MVNSGLAGIGGWVKLWRMNFDYNSYFERKPGVCGGELVVKGTRVTVRTLLASLAEGASLEEIRADYPTVSPEGLRAVVAFAAA